MIDTLQSREKFTYAVLLLFCMYHYIHTSIPFCVPVVDAVSA